MEWAKVCNTVHDDVLKSPAGWCLSVKWWNSGCNILQLV